MVRVVLGVDHHSSRIVYNSYIIIIRLLIGKLIRIYHNKINNGNPPNRREEEEISSEEYN